jgi:glucokinase
VRIAGFDIGGTSVKAGLFDTEEGLLCSRSFPTPLEDPSRMVELIAKATRDFEPSLVGVGTAGSIDTHVGLVRAGNLNWWGVPLRRLLEERLCLPVWVDNDAQAALMAEAHDGACKGVQSAVYLTLGTGIGGAAIIDGRPWRGHNNTALELGHMVTHGDGLPCACSRRGCFEMYTSARALSRMAGGAPAREVISRARDGEAAMAEAFASYLHELAIGLMSLTSIFNPQVFVLGGGLSEAGEFLRAGAEAELYQMLGRRKSYFQGKIALARHGNEAGMIGAALLARHYLVTS